MALQPEKRNTVNMQEKVKETPPSGHYSSGVESTSILATVAEMGHAAPVAISRFAVPTLHDIVAKMREGKPVKIACYGDSTTDGSKTSGWTANPTSGGVPVGNSDHECTAPNAWPAKLKLILRDMFGNNAIDVWNAGYKSRRLDNGWALENYDKAVTNNPFYGVPDLCFIGFGLNDAKAADVYEPHLKQTLALCLKLIKDGTLPVLLTCDAIQRNNPDGRNSEKATQIVDSAKRAVAYKLGIPIFEVGAALRQWASCNSSGYTWHQLQPDGLHFGDLGHAFKAGFIASQLYPDLIYAKEGIEIVAQDPRWKLNSSLKWGLYTGAATKSGRNYYAYAGGGTELMRGWVWNDDPDLTLCGLIIAGGGQRSQPPRAKFELWDTVSGIKRITELSGTQPFGADEVLASDWPMSFRRIPVGLSRIRSLIKEGVAKANSYSSDLLFVKASLHGFLVNLRIPSGVNFDANNYAWFTSEERKHCFEIGEDVLVEVEAILPAQTGVVFWHCRGWQVGTRWKPWATQGLCLYRDDNRWILTLSAGNQAGMPHYGYISLAETNLADIAVGNENSVKFSLELTWSDGVPNVAIKNQNGVEVLARNLDGCNAAIGGYIGGLVYRQDAAHKPSIKMMSWGPM